MDRAYIIPLDLEFQGVPGVIAAYLLPHANGAALIEAGPGSTQENLTQRLAENGYTLADISDVFLTHIHLDHAGAAGWLAQYGAQIHVHPAGASHLIDPVKLIASATRLYGDKMKTLWGDFLPVPSERISILQDGAKVNLTDISLLALATPGHASHHMAYVYKGVCFSGDVGGVRLGGRQALRVPMPPPEFHLETWRSTLQNIASLRPLAIAPTHFGIYNDPEWHLATMLDYLDQIESWMASHLGDAHTPEEIQADFKAWVKSWNEKDGLQGWSEQAYELANPTFMSLDGMQRYWRKYRNVLV